MSAFCPHFLFPPSSESRERQRAREAETVGETDRQPERTGGRRAEEEEQEEDYAGRVPSQVCNWGGGGGGVQDCESVYAAGGGLRGGLRERRSDRGGGRRGNGGPCPAELAEENVSRGASHAVSNSGRLRAPSRLLSPAAGRPRRCRRRKTDAPQSPLPGSDPRSRQLSTPVSGASSLALDPRWGPVGRVLLCSAPGGGPRPLRAPRSGQPDPVAAVPAVRSVFVSTGARGSAGLGSKPGRQCREGGGGGGREGGRGGGVLGFPGRPAAPPARGRGARPALPRAPSSFPLPPSLDLKLQFALQLAENVVGGNVGGTVGAENKAGF